MNYEKLLEKSKCLEIGSGQRPSPGYISSDINAFDGIDVVASPWEIDLPDNSLDEVLSLGVMEHFTYINFDKCLNNIYRMLKIGGSFYFDVPDIVIWCQYVTDHFSGKEIPFTIDHVFATLYGWQRWEGDEHKSGWYQDLLKNTLDKAGFIKQEYGVNLFLDKGITRNRMLRPTDAHIYCKVIK